MLYIIYFILSAIILWDRHLSLFHWWRNLECFKSFPRITDILCGKVKTETQVYLIPRCFPSLEKLDSKKKIKLGRFQILKVDFIQLIGNSTSICVMSLHIYIPNIWKIISSTDWTSNLQEAYIFLWHNYVKCCNTH